MDDLNRVERDCLYVLAGMDTPKRRDLQAALENYYDKQFDRSTLYSYLNSFAEEGLIEKFEDGDRSYRYELTPKAADSLEERRDWEDRFLDGT